MKTLSVIIPCYNEEKTIHEIVRRVGAVSIKGWKKEIIVVDDCSKQPTIDAVRALEKSGAVQAVYLEKNQGKGGAVKAGLARATGEYVIIQDADLEYNPLDIPGLVHTLAQNATAGDKTIVFGSRNIHHEKRSGFIIPRLGVWFITKLINVLYRQHLTDVWTCYKLFPRSAVPLFQAGHFESEIIFTLAALMEGYTIVEAPISHAPRTVAEGKKIRYRDGIQTIFVILGHRLLHLTRQDRHTRRDKKEIVAPLLSLLRAPKTHALLSWGVKGKCLETDTGAHYTVDDAGRPHLIAKAVFDENKHQHISGINWLKSFLKQFPRLYYSVWHVVCPAFMLINGPRMILKYVQQGKERPIILDVGSGPERLGREFINLDVFPFPEVDIVSDATALPFASESVDAGVSRSVFEHVPRADYIAKEMVRVLKPGGYFYVSAPFIHPYHASPDDFNRWTRSGLAYLFTSQEGVSIEIVKQGVRSGPWSALLLFLAYWLGNVLSLGYAPIAPLIAHIIMLPFGLLKYLDFIFMAIPGSDVVAAHLYIIGRKKG